jgi:hypothetical protein
VFGSELSFLGGGPGGGGPTRGVDAVLARAQSLVDTPRPDGGRPLAWHVEAMLVGDLSAVAVAATRASRSGSESRLP